MPTLNLPLYNEVGFSTEQIRKLEELININQLHWITLNENGTYDLVLDNHMMSTYRACPSHFIEAFVEGLALKGSAASADLSSKGGQRIWFLDFGILFHKTIEEYYKVFRTPGFNPIEWVKENLIPLWLEMGMDVHSEHREYKIIGGPLGYVSLILQYIQKYSAENERLRIIGSEISFGKRKEVPLGVTSSYAHLYLSGRIDLLVDDGLCIAPLDHKTKANFYRDPVKSYEVEEGPTGYVFAVKKIIKSFLEETNQEELLKRNTNKIIMNFISKKAPGERDKNQERFKRIPLLKTDEQLECYRLRMLDTGDEIFRTLINYANHKQIQRNTNACTNWYMRDCAYLPIHRQNSKENELLVINSFYQRVKIWDTESLSQDEGDD